MDVMREVAMVQEEYQRLINEKKLTKKNICDLVIPFRDKFKLTDKQALMIARAEMSIPEIHNLFSQSLTQKLGGLK